MEPRQRTSGVQFAVMLEFMERHGDLSKPECGLQGRHRSTLLWEELAHTLNSIRGGVNKSPDKWKKVWADWKSKTKKKTLMICRQKNGGTNRVVLTPMEERLMAMVGELTVQDLSDVEEQCFNITPTIETDMVSTSQQPCPTLPSPQCSPPHPAAASTPPLPQHQTTVTISPMPSLTSPPSHSDDASPPRRHSGNLSKVDARRRRAINRAPTEFAAIERRRLRLEEKRVRNETRRLDIDEQRLDIERQRNFLLERVVDIADAICQQYLPQ
ncbi:hypothetical protein RR46_11165 [Papilio xuthus]|uniref:Regulatory protein zeste n=1 Tax=Papilio xuthus TaxID=66420 RepID=A0A194PZ71_PAPXU|nr:hypothetical protein RR46_11165 [Papilio xuthus]